MHDTDPEEWMERPRQARRSRLAGAVAAYLASRLAWLAVLGLAATVLLRPDLHDDSLGGRYGPLLSALKEVSRALSR